MENNNEKTGLKGFWEKHKNKILAVGAGLGAVGIYIIATSAKSEHAEESVRGLTEGLEDGRFDSLEAVRVDHERDCLVTYSVEDTGEVLWKDLCTEGVVEDMKESGMCYENIRKLNGLE